MEAVPEDRAPAVEAEEVAAVVLQAVPAVIAFVPNVEKRPFTRREARAMSKNAPNAEVT